MSDKRLIIIDSNSIIHRAYHALPPLKTKKGELVNAVYGFLLVFFRALREFQPDYVCACFDYPAPTFRHKKFKEYKAKRPPGPEELYQQIPKVKEILKTFSIPVFEKEGFEADDLIGTITFLVSKKEIYPAIESIILSGDLDILQLVDQRTKVSLLKRGVKEILLYDEKMIKEKFQGLEPEQLLDYKALKGDPSDNIPGVKGIGEKIGIQLLLRFGSLAKLYEEIENNSPLSKTLNPRLKENLLRYKEQALTARELIQIKRDVPLNFQLEECRFGKYQKEEVIQILKDFEFFSLISRLPQIEREKSIGENLKLW